MHLPRLLLVAALGPALLAAAERPLKIDHSRSFVEVDVKSTLKNFTAHLDTYEVEMNVDDSGKIKNAVLQFKFTDLRTGDDKRNSDMIRWLGGGAPTGKFELGILAVAPDGQGQVTGKLTFHSTTKLIEFPVNVARDGGTYTITGNPTIDYRDWDLKVIKMGLKYVLNTEVGHDVRIRFKFVGAPGEAATTR